MLSKEVVSVSCSFRLWLMSFSVCAVDDMEAPVVWPVSCVDADGGRRARMVEVFGSATGNGEVSGPEGPRALVSPFASSSDVCLCILGSSSSKAPSRSSPSSSSDDGSSSSWSLVKYE